VSLADELLGRWAPIVGAVELKSGDHGQFEVTLDGKLTFSKAEQHRFPKPGEVAGSLEAKLGPPLHWRKTSG